MYSKPVTLKKKSITKEILLLFTDWRLRYLEYFGQNSFVLQQNSIKVGWVWALSQDIEMASWWRTEAYNGIKLKATSIFI